MKIVQIIPEFKLAGAETMCENLVHELTKQGHSVLVISMYSTDSPITNRLRNAGIEIEFLGKKTGFDISIVLKMRKIFKEFKPDVIHTHLYSLRYSALAAFRMKAKMIHTVHNIADKETTPLGVKLYKVYYKIFDITPVALSEIIQDSILKLYKKDKASVPVVFNGVNLDKCEKKESYSSLNTVKFLHVGRFSEQKNHLSLINAFSIAHKATPNIELFLYGEGELKEKCEEMVCSLDAQSYIHFCGLTDNIYSVMNKMDVFFLPSLWEGVPMSLIEAMGTGMPIIASKVGGIPNMLVNNESALLIETKENDMVESIKRMTENIELRTLLGVNAYKRSDVFSARRMTDLYLNIYNS